MTSRSRKIFPEELRSRAVRMVFEQRQRHPSQWAAIRAIAPHFGCSAETLRGWVRQTEREGQLRIGPASFLGERIRKLERENRNLKKANEILREANRFFPEAVSDRRSKT